MPAAVGDPFDPDVRPERVQNQQQPLADHLPRRRFPGRDRGERVGEHGDEVGLLEEVQQVDDPHRAATSVCSARRFSGTFNLPRSGMCQRGSPRCVLTRVSPDRFLLIASAHSPIDARISPFRAAMNSPDSSGCARFSWTSRLSSKSAGRSSSGLRHRRAPAHLGGLGERRDYALGDGELRAALGARAELGRRTRSRRSRSGPFPLCGRLRSSRRVPGFSRQCPVVPIGPGAGLLGPLISPTRRLIFLHSA